MKRAGLFAAAAALVGATLIATPSFGVQRQDPCDVLQKQLNTLEVRLAHQGLDSRRGGRTLGRIEVLKETAKLEHCHLK